MDILMGIWMYLKGIWMYLKMYGLQLALLCFLISLLANMLQRRYSRARLNRMIGQEESIIDFLGGMHRYLGKVERDCTLEMRGASSPQEIGKAIHSARNEIQSTMGEMEAHLQSFREYRRKMKAREKQKKRIEKLDQRSAQ